MVAQGFFVGAVGVAIGKAASNTSSTSIFVNVEAHSIAFSALYFWLIPAVFLSSIIGVSQTENAVPRILGRFQSGLNQELGERSFTLPNHLLASGATRIENGGIYSWKPDRPGEYESKQFFPLVQRNGIPLFIVCLGTITAMSVSWFVPPDGWQPRQCAQASILLAWILSFSLTFLLKRYIGSISYDKKWRFRLTFIKDLLATSATMIGIVVTQIGIFNRCIPYARWGQTGLALPEMPEAAAILDHRIRTVYPAITFASIGIQMVIFPVFVLVRYWHAIEVFLQRDDGTSNFRWFGTIQWRRRWETLFGAKKGLGGARYGQPFDDGPQVGHELLEGRQAV